MYSPCWGCWPWPRPPLPRRWKSCAGNACRSPCRYASARSASCSSTGTCAWAFRPVWASGCACRARAARGGGGGVGGGGGAVSRRAREPIKPTRLQLQDADTGALILLDIAAEPAKDGEPALEPVRIVEGSTAPARYGDQPTAADEDAPARGNDLAGVRASRRETPIPAVLTRFAAQ